MACFSPISLRTSHERDVNLPGKNVPCGKCAGCMQKRRNDWAFRLKQEFKSSVLSSFLTLTYDDDHLPKSLNKKELQKYFKRVRNDCKELKYYAVGEYGSQTNRPHYHAIVFNVPHWLLTHHWRDKNENVIGFARNDTVTDASIMYVTKYLINDDYPKENVLKPFSIMSKGLGKIYLKKNEKFHKNNFTLETTMEGGRKVLIPRYYRDKIFSEKERQELSRKVKKKAEMVQEKCGYDKIMSKRKGQKISLKKSSKSKKV